MSEEMMTEEEKQAHEAAGEAGEVTFTIMTIEGKPDNFVMFRNVGDYTTHWLTPNGAWVAMPDSDEAATRLLKFLVDSDDLPTLDQ